VTFLALLGAAVRSGAANAGRMTVSAAKAVGRRAVVGVKQEFTNRTFNPRYQGVGGFLNPTGGTGGYNQSNSTVSQNDLGVYALSQMIDREFQRITGAEPKIDADLSTPIENVPDLVGDNLPYILRLLERNVQVVDGKVQTVGRNIKRTEDLFQHAKRMLERTNNLLEANIRASSAQRFKDLEDRMEQSQSIASVDQQVQAEIEDKVSAMEERLREEFGQGQGGMLESILGLFDKGVTGPGAVRSSAGGVGMLRSVTAGAAALAPTSALASLPPEATAANVVDQAEKESRLTRFVNSVNNEEGTGDQPNQADYERLMGRVSDSKSDRATVVSTDLYDLVARAAFFSADSLSLSSKRSTDISSDGSVTITSKQEIVLDAPVIRLNGTLIVGQSASSFMDSTGQGGVSPTGSDAAVGGGSSGGEGGSSLPEGVTPLSGDETINTTEGGDRASEAFRYFKSKGWSDEAAAAIVGNLQQESGPSIDFTNNTGDRGNAFGSAQWNRAGSPDRYANFKKLYGKDLTEATWPEQLEFINWELTSGDKNNVPQKKAGDMLKQAKSVEEATLVGSHHFERPSPAYANNGDRIANASDILKKKDVYMAQEKENPILTKKERKDATFQGEAPEGYHTGMAPLKMTNQGATRHYDIEPDLKSKLQEAVYTTYGPGYTVEVYSGGQDEAGHRKLKSSTRHNIDDEGLGQAADVYIIDPNGKRVTGDDLGKLGQYWQAKNYGGTGLQMEGGGIHLDGHTDRARTWNYGKGETKEAKEAVQAGITGKLPGDLHYVQDEVKEAVIPVDRSVEEAVAKENAKTLKMYPKSNLDSPVAKANNVGNIVASEPVKAAESPKPPIVSASTVQPSGPKSRKNKNTHDGVNMSASDMLADADAVD